MLNWWLVSWDSNECCTILCTTVVVKLLEQFEFQRDWEKSWELWHKMFSEIRRLLVIFHRKGNFSHWGPCILSTTLPVPFCESKSGPSPTHTEARQGLVLKPHYTKSHSNFLPALASRYLPPRDDIPAYYTSSQWYHPNHGWEILYQMPQWLWWNREPCVVRRSFVSRGNWNKRNPRFFMKSARVV
jgi:hypothetical protein